MLNHGFVGFVLRALCFVLRDVLKEDTPSRTSRGVQGLPHRAEGHKPTGNYRFPSAALQLSCSPGERCGGSV